MSRTVAESASAYRQRRAEKMKRWSEALLWIAENCTDPVAARKAEEALATRADAAI